MSAQYLDYLHAENLNATEFFGKYLRISAPIADNFSLLADMPSWIYLRATAARDVLMPAVTSAIDGKIMFLYNEGTGTITLKTSSDAALSPAVTLAGAGTTAVMQALFGLAVATAWKKLAA